MNWRPAVVAAATTETPNARTLRIDAEGWSGHVAGQHVDVRLTAEDGYTAYRSYSISSSATSPYLEITVDRLDDGEVSPFLVDDLIPGAHVEVRGPGGQWFVWPEDDGRPVQLIGGGSGVVPLMSMVRTHRDIGSSTPFRLLYSVRTPELALFAHELAEAAATDAALTVDLAYSRAVPAGWQAPPARLDLAAVSRAVFPPSSGALVFICGATPFVEGLADFMLDLGYDAHDIRTERYGG